jgi:hypothetical protein
MHSESESGDVCHGGPGVGSWLWSIPRTKNTRVRFPVCLGAFEEDMLLRVEIESEETSGAAVNDTRAVVESLPNDVPRNTVV